MLVFFFFQAEDGIRDAQESRGLGDVYKRQTQCGAMADHPINSAKCSQQAPAQSTTPLTRASSLSNSVGSATRDDQPPLSVSHSSATHTPTPPRPSESTT
eukprot:TRINITY_DN27292_c0_g1_i1.p1 TRINITY_DN27292_c0_g1~~TRINITY_DN27292_c0_g1_i1.p1  ORF type:complete len:100 (+),score=25.20 TRINITY_DN27292_c0_g1_i1:35-334(+)